jgi:hypothetical protein
MPDALPAFAPGTIVNHASFGAGRVIEALDADVRVAFDRDGERLVRAEYLERETGTGPTRD